MSCTPAMLRWENPLMGWTSSADSLESVGRASLFFYTKEQAVDFCKKHGWEYSVDEPNEKRLTRQKRYADYSARFWYEGTRLTPSDTSRCRVFTRFRWPALF